YFRITPRTLAELNGRATYRLNFDAITNEVFTLYEVRSSNVLTPDILRQLESLDGVTFMGRESFTDFVDSVIGSHDAASLKRLIIRLSQTGGLPEQVLTALEPLNDTLFPTQNMLEGALSQALGAETFPLHREAILEFVERPGSDPGRVQERVDRESVV